MGVDRQGRTLGSATLCPYVASPYVRFSCSSDRGSCAGRVLHKRLQSDCLDLRLLRRLRLMERKTVLFICVENACRSLMAEAMFNADPPPGWIAISAGTRPAAEANPRTAQMLAEIGLSLPSHPPTLLTREMMDSAGERVTMGCLDDASCPVHLKGRELRDWALPDPSRRDAEGFRRVRDQLLGHVKGLRTALIVADRTTADSARDASR